MKIKDYTIQTMTNDNKDVFDKQDDQLFKMLITSKYML